MKNISTIAMLSLAALTIPAGAYQKAENIEEAQSKAGKEGIVLVTYAEGWDKYSKKTAMDMLESPAVKKALGNAVVLKWGVPNVSTKEQNEANAKRFGKIDLSFPDRYPAFIFYNKEGYRLADLCISFDERKKHKLMARRIKETISAMEKQADLLARADQASGLEQARLLGEASVVPGLRKPKDVAKRIQQADPDGQTGMHQLVTLNLYATAIESAGTKDWEATLAEIKSIMKNPNLSVDQQQQACCICIGLLRRHGGLARKEELKAMIDKLESLNPDSLLGQSAKDARRLWVRDLTLAEGWSPDVIPSDTTPVEIMGEIPMKSAGTYTVTFKYTSGTHAARIAALELYDGKKKVAEDRHTGSTGHQSSNNVYTLNVPASVRNPRLYVTFDMASNRNSYGTITVEKK